MRMNPIENADHRVAVAAQLDAATRTQLQDTAKRCFDRVVEVQKARLTVDLFLALTTVTLTGFAFQNKRAELFFVAACVPLFCVFIDLMMKRGFIIPFLYKAFVADFQVAGEGSEVLLFLDYSGRRSAPYIKAIDLPSETERRLAFRKLYLKRTLGIPLLLSGAGSTVEVALGIFVL